MGIPPTPPYDWWIWHDDPSVTALIDRVWCSSAFPGQTASPNWLAVRSLSRPHHETSGAGRSAPVDGVHGRAHDLPCNPVRAPSQRFRL